MHPDDGLLVAYSRHQLYADTREAVQRHIESCTTCRARCVDYEYTGRFLEAWARTSAYRSYPSLSERVMRRVRDEHLERGKQAGTYKDRRVSWRVLSLPLALLLLLLLSVVIAMAHLSSSMRSNPTPTAIQSTVVQSQTDGIQPPAHQPSPTAGVPTVVAASAIPTINECTSAANGDASHSRIRICGVNFTPRSRVYLILYLPGGHEKQRKSLLTDGQGRFQDVITISRCRDVPLEIVAKSVSKPAQQSEILENIQFGDCTMAQVSATSN